MHVQGLSTALSPGHAELLPPAGGESGSLRAVCLLLLPFLGSGTDRLAVRVCTTAPLLLFRL